MTIGFASAVKKPPGTAFVAQSKLHGVSVPWWCEFHQTPIKPEWMAANGQVLPACPWCLKDEIPEPTFVEEAGEEEEEPGTGLCLRIGCVNPIGDNQCQFCSLGYCDNDMEVTGPQGLCKNCGRQ